MSEIFTDEHKNYINKHNYNLRLRLLPVQYVLQIIHQNKLVPFFLKYQLHHLISFLFAHYYMDPHHTTQEIHVLFFLYQLFLSIHKNSVHSPSRVHSYLPVYSTNHFLQIHSILLYWKPCHMLSRDIEPPLLCLNAPG